MKRVHGFTGKQRRLALGVLGVGLVLACLAGLWQSERNARLAARDFDEMAQAAAHRLAAQIAIFEYGARGARSAVIAGGFEALDQDNFHRFMISRDIAREFPGAGGYGLIRRVAPSEEKAFIASVHRDGNPDFALRQYAPHAGDRYIIEYVEPLAANREAVGYDAASEPQRRAAAQAAMRSGRATITSPLTLVQHPTAVDQGVLVMLPIYRTGSTPPTESERTAAFFGWIFAPLLIPDVMAKFDFNDHQFELVLRDSQSDSETALFATPGSRSPAAMGLLRKIEIPVYDRKWVAEVRATPAFLDHENQFPANAMAGLVLLLAGGLAVAGYFYLQSRSRDEAAREEQARRAAIVASSTDAIISMTLDGVLTDWNGGAQEIFGYSAAEILGRQIESFLVPPDRVAEDQQIRQASARGERMKSFDTMRRHKDGSLIPVSCSAMPVMGAGGQVIGISKTLRDISATKNWEELLLSLNAGLETEIAARTASLESARHDLQTVLDSVPSVIGYCDRNLRNRFINRASIEWFGRDPAAVAGQHIKDLLGEQFEPSLPFIEAALCGQAQTFERTLPGADGAIRHCLTHYLPDVVGGAVRGFYAVMHDITQQTNDKARLESVLRENEALMSTIRLHTIFSIADVRGDIVEINDNFSEISGYTREELIGSNHRIVNSGVHPRGFWVDMWRTVATGQAWRGQVCNKAKNGSMYWVDSIIAPFLDAAGRIEKYISIRIDITAAKLAEEKLRASEAFSERAGTLAGVGGWEVDLRANTLAWSAQTCRIHDVAVGVQPTFADAVGFYTPESRPLIEETVTRAIATGAGWDLELPIVTAKGRNVWVRAVGTVERENGQAIRLVGAVQDITTRKDMELKLQRTNERFAVASFAAQIGFWEYAPQEQALDWDAQMYALYGYRPDCDASTLVLWNRGVHPDDRNRYYDALQAALLGMADLRLEFRVVLPSGETRHLRTAAHVARDAEGIARRFTGVCIDITERKNAELGLRATSSLLNSVLESASEVSIIATDPELNITVFNAGAEKMLGYSKSELIGRTTPALIHDRTEMENRSAELTRILGRPVVNGAIFTEPSTLRKPREWTYVRKDGSRLPVSLVVTSMVTDSGEIFGYLGVATDVTRQKEHEAELNAAISRAEDANLAKSQFLANMSHEIRTPMNAVIGLSYLLRQTELSEDQRSFLAKIDTASKSLLGLINDILDLSKIEAGELTIEKRDFDLQDLLCGLHSMMNVPAAAKGVSLDFEMDPDIPRILRGDSGRVHQVLTNLLSNAIKFTEQGKVRLTTRWIKGETGSVRLRFTVIDSGIGIAEDVQKRLFTPFTQADDSITRRFGGTGLGLSIVKQLTERLGGEITLKSAPGEGSEFCATFPFEPGNARALPEPSHTPRAQVNLQGVRILIVDDSEINLEVAKRILELEGAQVCLARDGLEAVGLLAADRQRVDIVLMDAQMPKLDGYGATRRIREELGLSQLPVIALTAGALSSERQRAQDAGMNDFVTKPFEARHLIETICRHVQPAGKEPDHAQDAVQRAMPGPPVSWPSIEGIDEQDVRTRLGDDLALFRSGLRGLIAEFSDLKAPDGPMGTDAANALVQRVHKLKGTSGLIGARGLHRFSGACEVALRDGRWEQVASLFAEMMGSLAKLQAAAAPFLDRASPAASEPLLATRTGLPTETAIGLLHLLQEQDLSALDCFDAIAGELSQIETLGNTDNLRALIDSLQFREAAVALQIALGLAEPS